MNSVNDDTETTQNGVVKYTIYPISEDTDLKSVKLTTERIINTTLKNYIWNADLKPSLKEDENKLFGEYEYGDAVDDEWATVLALLQLSKECVDVVIHVVDQDGQFLLIEAAEYLPEWMDPDGMQNRVFIRSGGLQCIPPVPEHPSQVLPLSKCSGHKSVDDCPPLLLSDALSILSTSSKSDFEADLDITKTILSRLPVLSDDVLLQKTKLTLPTPIAASLSENPQLISKIASSVDSSSSSHLTLFNPSKVGRSTSMVTASRYIFAKLSLEVDKLQRSNPTNDKNQTDSEKRDLYLASLISNSFENVFLKDQKTLSEAQKAAQKKTTIEKATQPTTTHPKCGVFSEGLQHAREINDKNKSKIAAKNNKLPGFTTYLQRLEKMGYFGDEIKGSKLYNEKLEAAKKNFGIGANENNEISSEGCSKQDDNCVVNKTSKYPWDLPTESTDGNKLNFATRVLHSIELWKQHNECSGNLPLSIEFKTNPSDSTDWLTVTPQSVDALLSHKFDPNLSQNLEDDEKKKTDAAAYESAQQRLKETVEKMDSFMKSESDYKGVETTDSKIVEEKESPANTKNDGEYQFNRKEYEKRRKELLGIIDLESDDEEPQKPTSKDPLDCDSNNSEDSDDDIDPEELSRYINELSSELRSHSSLSRTSDDNQIDNALNSITESIKAQGGGTGPALNILNQLGL